MTSEKEEGPLLIGRGHLPLPAPLITLSVLIAAFAFLFAMKALHRNEDTAAAAPTPSCAVSRALANRLKPLVHGHIAALALDKDSEPMPELSFVDPDGKPLKLSEFRGRNILLNLWASWCIPCRLEMPTLDRLEGKEGGNSFQVVVIDVDTTGPVRPKAFWKEIGIKNLLFYADPKADVFETLKQDGKVLGLPTTILIGEDGCEIGMMSGPAEWDSTDALTLLSAIKGY